mmetsp:Transcript_39693/g.112613  ORF Transcript_39693/g.112613 Transcript_39693/m.112613 type:complete len:705 (-) Transcript_39693:127-2241(-)|eukprot:CAMPEP_0117681054 /NCGR_PEP_ID=MMETSP0804-20121206/18735_1 /TAXON_ID=1074897 /ORGANISM="Tetraselmis astigmatica, Strain CCMP880" /LENGTH=704 /DNA_ID=CAMNT_0005490701 /DNA_START=73 /DNA_END=2187 /DNA_ORIENTATION=-
MPAKVLAQLDPDRLHGFPWDGFNIEEVQLPEGDDLGVPSDDDDDLEEEIQSETGFGRVLVVDNLPKVGPEKLEKLTHVLKKIFGQIVTVREGSIFFPSDDAKQTKGFCFIECNNPEEAQTAKENLHNYKLDKAHTLSVNLFDDFEKYDKVPDEYVAPEIKEYQPRDNLQQWMMDKQGRDQFAVRYQDQTEVCWNDARRGNPEEVYKRAFWTESFVQWSPRGNMLATMHRQGVAVWGGPSFTRLNKFGHSGVRLIDFSPAEKYMVSYSAQEPNTPSDTASVALTVNDVRSGRKLRTFQGPATDFAMGPGGQLQWPVFKWDGACNDKYFARMGKNMISVYEAPEMGLLDKKSIRLDCLQDFSWCPTQPIIAAFQTEQSGGNLPARVTLIKIPERTELRQKNLFAVAAAKMFWHPQGDYLAVQVDRYTKTKKSTYTSFELFRMKERDIPMEVMELQNKSEKIVAFAWEPKGDRFVMVHGDGARPDVSFYTMKDGNKGVVKQIGTLTNKPCNAVYWSPQGKNIVLAGLKALNGQLEFFNVDEFETMATGEHFMATDVEWDPTGRYIATSVTHVHQMENGFNMWAFNGKLLYRIMRDQFFQFSWRPRHSSLLSIEQEQEIYKNLKKYSKRYDEEDEALLMEADQEVIDKRRALMEEWKEWKESKKRWLEEIEPVRKQILGSNYELGEYTVNLVEEEVILDVKEEKWDGA